MSFLLSLRMWYRWSLFFASAVVLFSDTSSDSEQLSNFTQYKSSLNRTIGWGKPCESARTNPNTTRPGYCQFATHNVSTGQHSAAQHNTAQHSAAQHIRTDTAQHIRLWHSTVQHSISEQTQRSTSAYSGRSNNSRAENSNSKSKSNSFLFFLLSLLLTHAFMWHLAVARCALLFPARTPLGSAGESAPSASRGRGV